VVCTIDPASSLLECTIALSVTVWAKRMSGACKRIPIEIWCEIALFCTRSEYKAALLQVPHALGSQVFFANLGCSKTHIFTWRLNRKMVVLNYGAIPPSEVGVGFDGFFDEELLDD
jgi:hypothetical protein